MSFTSRTGKCLKIWSLYNVGDCLYRVFTTAKKALSFQRKISFIQDILFSFFKWDTLVQKKGTFFSLKRRGGQMPRCPPVQRLLTLSMLKICPPGRKVLENISAHFASIQNKTFCSYTSFFVLLAWISRYDNLLQINAWHHDHWQ
jgi:hypothetical protein